MDDDRTGGDTPSEPIGEPTARVSPAAVPPAIGEPLRHKFQLAVIVAVLSFLGALGAALVSGRIEESRWRREIRYTAQREVLQKRMELLERTIRIINRMQTLDIASSAASYSLLEGQGSIRSGGSGQAGIDAVSATTARIKEVQGDLAVVMTLDMIYFGPKTIKAVRDLEKSLGTAQPWWKVDAAKTQALLDALSLELSSGLGDG
jgi:hypothetical protein